MSSEQSFLPSFYGIATRLQLVVCASALAFSTVGCSCSDSASFSPHDPGTATAGAGGNSASEGSGAQAGSETGNTDGLAGADTGSGGNTGGTTFSEHGGDGNGGAESVGGATSGGATGQAGNSSQCGDGFVDADGRAETGCECKVVSTKDELLCCASELGVALCYPKRGGPAVKLSAATITQGCRNESSSTCEADELPARQVELSAFAIDIYEVTQQNYQAYLEATGAKPPPVDWSPERTPNNPAVYVNFNEARAYCNWVGGDLPTEAQWEYAAQGPGSAQYPWGDDEPECGRVNVNDCETSAVAVGSSSLDVSIHGVHDMAGNVAEWTRDWYIARPLPQSRAALDPEVREGGTLRTIRGASFEDWPPSARISNRSVLLGHPETRSMRVGFRCVREAPRPVLEAKPLKRTIGRFASSRQCALKDGKVACWVSRLNDVVPEIGGLIDLDNTQERTCALDQSGVIHCWSADGTNVTEYKSAGSHYIDVVADWNDTVCGLQADGRATCWQGSTVQDLPKAQDLVQLANSACGVRHDGTVTCWNDRYAFPRGRELRQINLWSNDTGCGLKDDGSIVCWGPAASATHPSGPGYVQVIAFGSNSGCALHGAGRVDCWGIPARFPKTLSDVGELGPEAQCVRRKDGSIDCYSSLSRVPSPSGLAFVEGTTGLHNGSEDFCAVREDGSSSCLQPNQTEPVLFSNFAIGAQHCGISDGTLHCRSEKPSDDFPAAPLGNDFASVFGGWEFMCALRIDRTGTCWGKHVPALPASTHWASLSAAKPFLNAICGIDQTGTISCFLASDSTRTLPPIPTGTGFKKVATTSTDICALTADGSLSCNGPLSTNAPTEAGFKDIDLASNVACALNSKSQLECWGSGFRGPLPDQAKNLTFNGLALMFGGGVIAWNEQAIHYFSPEGPAWSWTVIRSSL